MSRCFPFPPPGYENKKDDSAELRTQEKLKAKKHKKDKKEKKERKEKKGKERSKDKHREKKDRKEKHKDKNKDRESSKSRDEKNAEGQVDGYSGHRSAEIDQNQAEEANNSKSIEELGQRFCNGGTGMENRVADEILTCRAEESGRGVWQKDVAEDNNIHGRKAVSHRNGDKTSGFGSATLYSFKGAEHRSNEGSSRMGEVEVANKETKYDRNEETRRNKYQKSNSGVITAQTLTAVDQRRVVGIDRMTHMATGNNDKKVDDRKTDWQRYRNADTHGEVAGMKTVIGMDQRKFETIGKPPNLDVEKKIEGIDTNKEKDHGIKYKGKQKDNGRENKSKGKDKDKGRHKEKREAKLENGSKKYEHLHEIKEVRLTPDTKSLQNPLPSNMVATTMVNSKKRKDTGTNGAIYDIDVRPTKLPSPVVSSPPHAESGRNLKPFQIPIQHSSVMCGEINNLKVCDKVEKLENGVVDCQPSSLTVTKSKSASSSQASVKKPHPDSKYLSKILNVPIMEELSDIEDQDWLFSSHAKQKMEFSTVEEPVEVWDKAKWIETAEIFALPYVVPY